MNVLRFTDLVAAGRAAERRVFIRADLNVPQDDAGRITEDTRIRASLPCIEPALDAGAAVMVTSHLGRPTEGEPKPEDSLAPVAARLAELLGRDGAAEDELGRRRRGRAGRAGRARELPPQPAARRRTTRRWRRKMAALCDVYVNDAFGTAHRAEATTYGIAEFAPIACAGPLLAAEIDAITQGAGRGRSGRWSRSSPARKVSTKLAILQSLAKNVDRLIVGGGIANTFLLAEGLPIGKSLAEPTLVGEARAVIEAMKARGADVPMPVDVVTAKDVQGRRGGDDEGGRRRRGRRPDPRHRPRRARQSLAAHPAVGGNDRLERAGRRVRVRRLRARHRDDRARDRRARRRSAWPAAATRWRRSPSTASPTRSTTSRPAAAPSSRCSKARPCRRSRSSSGAPATQARHSRAVTYRMRSAIR